MRKSCSWHRKFAVMKSAPTLTSRCRFHSFTFRHSGSSVATPTTGTPRVLDVLDFYIAVAESQQPVTAILGRRKNTLDENLFGKTSIIVKRSMYAAVEIAGNVKKLSFLLRVGFVRPAGTKEA